MKRRPDWFLLGMLLAVALAIAFPDAGAHGGPLRAELLNRFGVALIFFLHGLVLSFQALKRGTLNVRLHLVVQTATFVLFPLLGMLTFKATERLLETDLRVGLFFLGALPSTVASSVALTAAARGNVPGAVFNATASNLFGIIVTPLWLGVLLGAVGRGLEPGPVILDLIRWLLLPLAVGQALRPLFGGLAERHASSVSAINRMTILLLVYTSFCDSVKAGAWSMRDLPALALTFALVALLLACVTWLVAGVARRLGMDHGDRVAAILCGSQKTLAAGVPMARLIFGADPGLALILLPVLMYHPLQLILGAWLVARWERPTFAKPHGF